MENIFRELPLTYKRHVTFADWLLALRGYKACKESFYESTYDKDEFLQFQEVFKKNGLKFSDTIKTKNNSEFCESFDLSDLYN